MTSEDTLLLANPIPFLTGTHTCICSSRKTFVQLPFLSSCLSWLRVQVGPDNSAVGSRGVRPAVPQQSNRNQE